VKNAKREDVVKGKTAANRHSGAEIRLAQLPAPVAGRFYQGEERGDLRLRNPHLEKRKSKDAAGGAGQTARILGEKVSPPRLS